MTSSEPAGNSRVAMRGFLTPPPSAYLHRAAASGARPRGLPPHEQMTTPHPVAFSTPRLGLGPQSLRDRQPAAIGAGAPIATRPTARRDWGWGPNRYETDSAPSATRHTHRQPAARLGL